MLFNGVKDAKLTGLLFQCLMIWDSIENTNLPPFRSHHGNEIWRWDVLQEDFWCLGTTSHKVWEHKWIRNRNRPFNSATHYQVVDYEAHMLDLIIICSSHRSNAHRNGLPSTWGNMSRLKSTVNFLQVYYGCVPCSSPLDISDGSSTWVAPPVLMMGFYLCGALRQISL